MKLGLDKEEENFKKLAEIPMKIMIQKLIFPVIYPTVFEHYLNICEKKDKAYVFWKKNQLSKQDMNEEQTSPEVIEAVRMFNTIVTKHSPAEKLDLLYFVYNQMIDAGVSENNVVLELISRCNLEHLVSEIAFVNEFYGNFPKLPKVGGESLGSKAVLFQKENIFSRNKDKIILNLLQSFRKYIENPSYNPQFNWPTETLINDWTLKLSNSDIEFFTTQFCYLLTQDKVSNSFTSFLIDRCKTDFHFALKMQMQIKVVLQNDFLQSNSTSLKHLNTLNDLIDETWRPKYRPLSHYKDQYKFVDQLELIGN